MSTRLIRCLTNRVSQEFARNRPEDDVESFLLVLAYALMRNVLESERDLGLQAKLAREAFETRFSAAAAAKLLSLLSADVVNIFQNLSFFEDGLSPVLLSWIQKSRDDIESKHKVSYQLKWKYTSISHDVLLGYLDDGITQLSGARTPNPISASTVSRT